MAVTAPSVSRRQFLRLGVLTAAAAALPDFASAASSTSAWGGLPLDRGLAFYNTHTREQLDTAYCANGRYLHDGLKAINHILRDHRTDEVLAIDTDLLDLLHRLRRTIGSDEQFHVISGYRSPMTNAMLRKRGGASTGVASRSLHMVGKAIDVRLPGTKLKDLREAAVSLKAGGVGYYPSSDFVHVDVGRVRYW